MKTENRLKRVFALLLKAVENDPRLANEIDGALGVAGESGVYGRARTCHLVHLAASQQRGNHLSG